LGAYLRLVELRGRARDGWLRGKGSGRAAKESEGESGKLHGSVFVCETRVETGRYRTRADGEYTKSVEETIGSVFVDIVLFPYSAFVLHLKKNEVDYEFLKDN